jgi:hypothetical protein
VILPNKYITLETSFIGLGAEILARLDTPKTVTGLWDLSRERTASYERFVLGLDFLYSIGAVELRDGMIARVNQ